MDEQPDPMDYPGIAAPSSGLLLDSRFLPLAQGGEGWEHALAAADVAPLDARALVVAVGSNAVPATVHRKLTAAGVRTVVVFSPCTVDGVAIGHSAHVSAGGYVPAAPFARPGVSTPMTASWFDAEQLAAVDCTEPNYRRLLLDADRYPLTLANGEQPVQFFVYESVHGLLTVDGATPVPLMTQVEIREYWPNMGRSCASGLVGRDI